MKATLLLENNSLFGTRYLAEHGFSLYIEDEQTRILYDMGYSYPFIKNAVKMGIDLTQLDYVIISHAHRDHSGGVKYLIKYYQENAVMHRPTMLVTGEDIFFRRRFINEENRECGFDTDRDVLERYFKLEFEPNVRWLTPNLAYLGKIPRLNDFEGRVPQTPKILVDGEWRDDYVYDDTQLAYRHKNGREVSVFSGCSHAGICNIMEYAKKVTGTESVHTFLGGLHLQQPPEEVIAGTVEYVKNAHVKQFYACHDTDMPSKIRLIAVSNFIEAGVSTKVELV